MRVLRVYHAGRDRAHRQRERALVRAGVDVTLVVPSAWPDHGSEATLSAEPFGIVELAVRRPGDVNRHVHADDAAIRRVIAEAKPDVLDLHEEPFSLVARQWLRQAGELPVVMYTAQNIDKRFPPPFAQYEQQSLRRVTALYPCSGQAASVARGKGFAGQIDVLPLGIDPTVHHLGEPLPDESGDTDFTLMLVGRMVPEKGVRDAVRVLADVTAVRPSRLLLVGNGPEVQPALDDAHRLGVADRVAHVPWCSAEELGALYRQAHVVLVPSSATATWVEQFGRVILEAFANGALVAGYRSGSIPEVAGDAGFLVPEGDVGALGSLVRDLAKDAGRLAAARDAGRVIAAQALWETVAQRQRDLYAAVASAERRRPPGPRSGAPRDARAGARAEFGETAATAVGTRPFALPIIRSSVKATAWLGAAIDTLTGNATPAP